MRFKTRIKKGRMYYCPECNEKFGRDFRGKNFKTKKMILNMSDLIGPIKYFGIKRCCL